MELSSCLKALGDPTRFAILCRLLERKHCTRSLSAEMGISEAAVSQHLKILREAGLVYREKYGYHMHYIPSREALDFLVSSFEDLRRQFLSSSAETTLCRCDSDRQEEKDTAAPPAPAKPSGAVRAAVPADGEGLIVPHFGTAKRFILYDLAEGKVIGRTLVEAGPVSHGALALFAAKQGADILICGSIGAWARDALASRHVRLYSGYEGRADDALQSILNETENRRPHLPGGDTDGGD